MPSIGEPGARKERSCLAAILSIEQMKFTIFILPALAMLAFAQEPTVILPVRLESISTESTPNEVRVNIDISAPVQSPGFVVISEDSLVWDLPGVAYEESAKHLIVNRGDVRDIFISLQQQTPPLTRLTVRLSRIHAYALSTAGGRITLRIGVGAQASSSTAKARANQKHSGPVPTARAGAIDRIFRRAPKQPVYDSAHQGPAAQPSAPTAPLSPIRFPETAPAGQVAGVTVPETSTSKATATPASQALEQGAAASNHKNTSAIVAGTSTPALAEQPLPVVRAAPRELLAATYPASPPRVEPASAGVEPPAAGAAANTTAVRPAPVVPNSSLRTVFHVKFVQQDVAYIDAGRNEGIAEGMKLVVVNADPKGALPNNTSPTAAVAELTVEGIAETSAVTEIHVLQRDVVPGDLAYLSDTDLQALVQQHSLSSTRKYPAVISFTEDDDALDDEARVRDVPRPPLPSVNRMQGRIGFDYFGTHSLDASQADGRDLGVVLRADFTRIGGTYWNFQGYYRGTLDSTSAAAQATLQETISRTYHLGLIYDNPNGNWVAGFGRLYLPWASSLDTLDGGYFGRRIHSGVITGVFAGSTPDPTSWNYSPNRQIGGAFVNFSGGSFDAFHYSSTTGAGTSLLSWAVDRPFLFFENSFSYRHGFSVYSAVQADRPVGNPVVAAPGPGIGSSFFTMRWSPVRRLQLDFNHTYFRNVPTFDPTLVGTGLLDKYLFQGFSGGARLEIVKQIAVYTELGRSNRTGDSSTALNEMYGVTFGRVPWLELRADAHYSRFNSSFGAGSYRTASLSRNVNERLRLEILLGDQSFISTLAGNQSARFVTATVENDVGSYLFTQGGFTVYRGQQQNYNQWMLMLGYRFDSRWKHK
jgi:hypothetical protein